MTNLTFATDYSSNHTLREKLYPLFEKVFGIPVSVLQDFYARGFWDETYQPYTYFADDCAVANVSRFTLPLLIREQPIQAAGIQSVMTDPAYRGKGLMKELFAKMLHDVDQQVELALLFTEIPELYQPFGFRQVQEHFFRVPFAHRPIAESDRFLRKLNFFNEQDLQKVRELLAKQTPISQHFAVRSYESSFFLNLYNPFFQEKLYVSDPLDALVIYEVKAGTLKLYDVIGPRLPALEALCAQIPEPFSQVEFYFHPELFCTEFEPIAIEKSHLMVRGDLADDLGCFKLPITAAF